jgi:hypothetical protein
VDRCQPTPFNETVMLGLDLLAAHMLGDFILQTEDMALRKLTNWRVRALHVTVYCVPFLLLVAWYWPGAVRATLFVALLWVTHFAIDSRRWGTGSSWAPKQILVDQTMHIVTLAALARLLVS